MTPEDAIGLLEPTVSGMGYDLVDVDVETGGRGLLRLFIDGPEGVTVDDCAKVSNQVSALLDVEDPMAGHYVLEVSSPGINRILRTEKHFEQFVGQRVKVRLQRVIDGRKTVTGELLGHEDGRVRVLMKDREYSLPLTEIKRARLAPEM